MIEIGNELGPSNTHANSGDNGLGIFTLIYYSISTEPTTYTSTHTTTVNSTVVNSVTVSTTTFITTTVNFTVVSTFSCTSEGKQPIYM